MNDLSGVGVTLIGGAGFMGHHLALGLKARGADVEIVDSLQVNNLLHFASLPATSRNRDVYLRMIHERLDLLRQADIKLIPVDARDYNMLTRTMVARAQKHRVIVHLAAVAHAGKSNKDPLSTFDHSLRTLENALDCARSECHQFIFISSSMVYGNFRAESVSEDHPLEPIGIYGALKLAGEKLVIAYNQVFDIPYTILRPSALYGPRCVSRRVGQIFVEDACDGIPLRIEGDGEEKLDFTYVDDLVEGICRTVMNPAAMNLIFNMTYGESRSINDLASIIRQYFPDIKIEHTSRDALRPVRGTMDIGRARSLLGYAPSRSIDEGMPRYIDWYRQFLASGLPREGTSTAHAS